MTKDNGMQSLNEQLALMRKNVRITLDWEDGDAFIVGKLVGLSEDGEGIVICDDGMRHHCWPVLKIEEYDGEMSTEVERTIQTANDNKLWVGIVASILGLCLLTIIVGLTVKFVIWVIP